MNEWLAGDAHRPRHKRGAGGPKDRRHGSDRDDLRKKTAPKSYQLESVVDRGFEDVADPATEGTTRRVDWDILKRTTADQSTARALSAIYVLRRDGTDSEFLQLSAAPAAVNKTITHPEKLTLSKAEQARDTKNSTGPAWIFSVAASTTRLGPETPRSTDSRQ